MKYITYKQSSEGRNGHILHEIITPYIFSFFIKSLEVIPHPTWAKQNVLKFKYSKSSFENAITIKSDREWWHGISINLFRQICNKIRATPEGSVFELTGVLRIDPVNLTKWYNQKLIKRNVFIDNFIPKIRDLYHQNQPLRKVNCLSIHARRGDIVDPNDNREWFKNMFWGVDYINHRIEKFRESYPDLSIYVFSERENSKDLHILKKHKNLHLRLGDKNSFVEDFNFIVSSEFFMPCNSGMSIMASYISRNKILMPIKKFNNKKFEIIRFHKHHIWKNV